MPGGTIEVPELVSQSVNGVCIPETQDEWGSWSRQGRGDGGLIC